MEFSYEVKDGVDLLFDQQDGFLVFGFIINEFHSTDWIMMNIPYTEDEGILNQISGYLSKKYIDNESVFYNALTDQLSRRKYQAEAMYWPLSNDFVGIT